jgi:hypothetical protein
MAEKNNPGALAGAHPGIGNESQPQSTNLSVPRKWQRVLRAFAAGRTLNRFEATRELHDWCLHSTVARLEGMDVTIQRKDEIVPGFQGAQTHACPYWLDPGSRDRTRELLDRDAGRGA